MIAAKKTPSTDNSKNDEHAYFLTLLPSIRRSALIAFRGAGPELREDLVTETVSRAFLFFVALANRGQLDRARPTPLARFAIAQVRSGRRVGNRRRIGELLSQYAQFEKGFIVDRIDYFDSEQDSWQQIVVEDRRASPADVAACRIDFAAWLRTLGARIRKIALALAFGETTKAVAKAFRLTPARISQIRRWLKENWHAFHGEAVTGRDLRAVTA